MSADRLRILSINVWTGLDYQGVWRLGDCEGPEHRELRFQALLRGVRELQPDVMGVNEANPLPAYAHRLARELEYDVYAHVAIGGIRLGSLGLPINLREGDAILARRGLDLRPLGSYRLTGGPRSNLATFQLGDSTQILGAEITHAGRNVGLYLTHWQSALHNADRERAHAWHRQGHFTDAALKRALAAIDKADAIRTRELRRCLRFMNTTGRDHQAQVLMGDFNATFADPQLAELRTRLVPVFRSNGEDGPPTWDPTHNTNHMRFYNWDADGLLASGVEDSYKMQAPDAKAEDSDAILKRLRIADARRASAIDHIFIDPESAENVIKAGRALDKVDSVTGIHASDHYGVYADLQW